MKIIKKLVALLMALTLIFAMTATASAAARTTYGSDSGSYTNEYRSNAKKFDNLPAGVLHINYALADTNNMQIRFYKNSSLSSASLADYATIVQGGSSTTVNLPSSGTYYVVIWSNNNIRKNFSYSYELYK